METVTEILVDISGSMKNKMIATKQALLNDIIPELDYSSRIGIKTFSTLGKPKQLSINPILPLNKTDKEVIKQKIQSISCSDGGTPIAATIKASVQSLAEYIANDKVIILVTDGAETEGGDYVLEAKKATEEGIKCKIHVIGIDLKEEDKLKAKEIARITGGTPNFITLPNSSYNQTQIRTNLTGFYQAVRKAPQIQTVSPPINQKAPSFIKVPEPQSNMQAKKEETKPTHETKTDGNINPTLELIVEQIKELRKELAELKKERKEIPEFDEDPIENEKIRKASEEYLFEILNKKYPDRVKWLNQTGESNEDHDFEILELDGATIEYYIECKGTPKNKPTFYLTKNEWRLFLNHTKNYQIYFVRNSFKNPNHIFIDNVLDWLLKGKIVPYLVEREVIKEERVFLTINRVTFNS